MSVREPVAVVVVDDGERTKGENGSSQHNNPLPSAMVCDGLPPSLLLHGKYFVCVHFQPLTFSLSFSFFGDQSGNWCGRAHRGHCEKG